jgi:PEP-CTERM motif
MQLRQGRVAVMVGLLASFGAASAGAEPLVMWSDNFSLAGSGSPDVSTTPVRRYESVVLGTSFDLEQIRINNQGAQTLTLTTDGFRWDGHVQSPGSIEVNETNTGGITGSGGSDPAPVPEPASLVLMGSGAVMAIGKLRRLRRR